MLVMETCVLLAGYYQYTLHHTFATMSSLVFLLEMEAEFCAQNTVVDCCCSWNRSMVFGLSRTSGGWLLFWKSETMCKVVQDWREGKGCVLMNLSLVWHLFSWWMQNRSLSISVMPLFCIKQGRRVFGSHALKRFYTIMWALCTIVSDHKCL